MPGHWQQFMSYSFLFTFCRSSQSIITMPLQITSFTDANYFVCCSYRLVHRKDNVGAGKNLQLYVFLRWNSAWMEERLRVTPHEWQVTFSAHPRGDGELQPWVLRACRCESHASGFHFLENRIWKLSGRSRLQGGAEQKGKGKK